MYQPIGFHAGPGGNPTGIGDYFSALDAAGIPAVLMCTDGYGICHELAQLARASSVPHVIAFRFTARGSSVPETPNYDLSPAPAADEHWHAYLDELAGVPEFDKELVRLVPINEVDKGRADWIGHFCTELAQRANADGYKVAMPAWSAGEPEPEHWETEGMLRFLRYCAENPDMAAVALHEYSLDDDLRHEHPHHVGRFQELFDVCDAYAIARPNVLITEFGWRDVWAPEPIQAMEDLRWAADLYAAHPQIRGAMIWYLGAGYSSIADRVQRLIEPVRDFSLESQWQQQGPGSAPDGVIAVTISHHQGEMDWEVTAARADVALIRISDGTTLDRNYQENVAGALAAGMLVQPFHYFRWDVDVEEQLYYFLDHIPPGCQLPRLVDAEQEDPSPYWIRKKLQAFLDVIELRTGRRPEIYTRANYWNEHLDGFPGATRYRLHVAHYGADEPLIPADWSEVGWFWWQYTDTAEGAAYGASSPHIALSVFNGDEALLRAYAGLPPAGATLEEYVLWHAEQHQAIAPNHEAALERKMGEDGRAALGNERWGEHPETKTRIATQAAYVPGREGKWAYFAEVGKWDDVGVLQYGAVTSPPAEGPEPGGDDETVSIPVPYLSQWGAGANRSPGDCGPAVVAMLVRYWTGQAVTVDEAAIAAGQPAGSRSTSISQLMRTLTHFGVRNTFHGGVTLDDVRQFIDESRPSILLIHYGSLPGNQDTYQAGHFVIPVGYGEDDEGSYFLVNDPNFWGSRSREGDHRRVSAAALERSMVETSQDGNYPRQAIVTSGPAPETPPPPPATGQGQGPARLGLHASADSGDLRPEEIGMFGVVRPGVVKILSSHANGVAELARNHPDATFVVRAFLDFGGRNVTPAQFVDWTAGDVERAIANVGEEDRVLVELHNEPNLRMEGWQSSWSTPEEFSDWLLDVRSRFASALPSAVRYIYPGLSPGGSITNIRYDWLDWLEKSRPAVDACDALGVHAYWAHDYPMAQALGVIDEAIRRFPGKPIWVTEASNNKSGDPLEKGAQYVSFWQALRQRPAVKGVTYFVASASDPDFADEVWLGRGIAEVVGSR